MGLVDGDALDVGEVLVHWITSTIPPSPLSLHTSIPPPFVLFWFTAKETGLYSGSDIMVSGSPHFLFMCTLYHSYVKSYPYNGYMSFVSVSLSYTKSAH